jgi:hypothetical protein
VARACAPVELAMSQMTCICPRSSLAPAQWHAKVCPSSVGTPAHTCWDRQWGLEAPWRLSLPPVCHARTRTTIDKLQLDKIQGIWHLLLTVHLQCVNYCVPPSLQGGWEWRTVCPPEYTHGVQLSTPWGGKLDPYTCLLFLFARLPPY